MFCRCNENISYTIIYDVTTVAVVSGADVDIAVRVKVVADAVTFLPHF